MPVRQVFQIGAPSLLEPSKLVETFNTPELESLIEDLQDTSTHYDGPGIAAPQIGVNVRVIYFGYEFSKRYPDAPPVPRTVMINPGFEPLSEEMNIAEEGCRCSTCGSKGLRIKAKRLRRIRHEPLGGRMTYLEIVSRKYHCQCCGSYFYQPLPGIMRYQRAT